ncbi:endoplasmic reticulum lectin 1 [Chrysoperla carnea]|uniref:endoplasmic reticulum lectin 1 n=1 Tax=Chrysoperla carnea TaxID=189513 RepID=UPI001D095435|nr:endoplasmic reticulum lectin 1 [Chrysoperla carnea]
MYRYNIFEIRYYLLVFLCIISTCICTEYHGLDDSVLFKLNWAGDLTDELLKNSEQQEQMIVKTAQNEKYKCFLPHLEQRELNDAGLYEGPSPIELLKSLFTQSMCTFRLESYWTYEICHGRYIRQYHEDREGKTVKLQEYFLGQWEKSEQLKIIEKLKEEDAKTDRNKNEPPTKRIEGAFLPYFEVTMEGGTVCDLNNKPRSTKVLYVCVPHGKHEVYSLKETSTCEYEVIILTPLLCSHPKYKPKETEENAINCVPLDGNPKKPKSLLAMEAESIKLRQQSKLTDDKTKKVFAVFKVDTDKGGEARVRLEIRPIDELEDTTRKPKVPQIDTGISDTSPVESFLLGKNCLNGGSGWWKYDFCYGRYIEQYHVEKDGSRTLLNLGRFDKKTHLAWLEKNPHKRPKPLAQRKQLSHFYSGGTVCDKTGKARQTEVKLKCLENSSSPGAVQLYLLEPKYCEYILGVESPIICDIIGKADENGLVEIPEHFDKTSFDNDLEDSQTSPAFNLNDNNINDVINE